MNNEYIMNKNVEPDNLTEFLTFIKNDYMLKFWRVVNGFCNLTGYSVYDPEEEKFIYKTSRAKDLEDKFGAIKEVPIEDVFKEAEFWFYDSDFPKVIDDLEDYANDLNLNHDVIEAEDIKRVPGIVFDEEPSEEDNAYNSVTAMYNEMVEECRQAIIKNRELGTNRVVGLREDSIESQTKGIEKCRSILVNLHEKNEKYTIPELDIDELKKELLDIKFFESIEGFVRDKDEVVYGDFRCSESVLKDNLKFIKESCDTEDRYKEAIACLIQTYGYSNDTKRMFSYGRLSESESYSAMKEIGKEDFIREINSNNYKLINMFTLSPVTPITEDNFVNNVLVHINREDLKNGIDVNDASEDNVDFANGYIKSFSVVGSFIDQFYIFDSRKGLDILLIKEIGHNSLGQVNRLRYFVFGKLKDVETYDFSSLDERLFFTVNNMDNAEEGPSRIDCRFYIWAEKYLCDGIKSGYSPEELEMCEMFVKLVSVELNYADRPDAVKFLPVRGEIKEMYPEINGKETLASNVMFDKGDCVKYEAYVDYDVLKEKVTKTETSVDFPINMTKKGKITSKATFKKVADHIINGLNKRSGAFEIKDNNDSITQWDLDRDGTEYTLINKNDSGENKAILELFQGKMIIKNVTFR